jgi:hypothetical protein
MPCIKSGHGKAGLDPRGGTVTKKARQDKGAGIEGVDLKGKTVVLSPKHYKGDEAARTFKCDGGFGCNPHTTGSAVFGEFVSDGERARVERWQISHLATTQEDPGKPG